MGTRSPFLALAREAALAADSKKALDVKLFDLRPSSAVADFVLVVTAESGPQATAVEEEIERRVEARAQVRPLRREGRARAAWRVLDYGGLVAHVMSPSVRLFYNLERLWESAREVPWVKEPARPRGVKRRVPRTSQ